MASFNIIWKPQYKRTDDPQKVRTIGYEFEGEYSAEESKMLFNHTKKNKDFRKEYQIAGIGSDGGGVEIVTHPDSESYIQRGGSTRFKKFVDYLQKEMNPDPASGTHIHIGRLPSDCYDTDQKIWTLMTLFGNPAQKIFGRISHWAQVPIQSQLAYSEEIREIKIPIELARQGVVNGNTKLKLNDHSKSYIVTFRNNTIEFRGPKASNNKFEILAWTQFCLNVVNEAAKEDNTQFGNLFSMETCLQDLLKGHYISRYVNSLEGPRKISYKDRHIKIKDMKEIKMFPKITGTYRPMFQEEKPCV